jgi:hypothetical protein
MSSILSAGHDFRYNAGMLSAIFNGCLGVTLAFVIGSRVLGLSAGEIGLCILASEISGLLSLLATLRMERVPFLRRYLINRSLKTWALFLCIYFGIILLIAPAMRDWRHWLWMTVPLMLGNGFVILLFGPIQDFLVRRDQRRAASN